MHYVYILASKKNGTLYIGTTRDLEHRIWEHKNGIQKGFTKKYNIKILVHYEEYNLAMEGVQREKQLKRWKRSWKIKLIEEDNPQWKNLSEEWYD